jgi:hypothetical protein
MLRFRSRLALLNARSEEFLNILVQLGGYCTLGQAKRIELADSDPRVLVRLRGLEQIGFLRKIAGYPVIFQVTKSATRLSACGSEGQTPTPAGNAAEPAVGRRLLPRRLRLAGRVHLRPRNEGHDTDCRRLPDECDPASWRRAVFVGGVHSLAWRRTCRGRARGRSPAQPPFAS